MITVERVTKYHRGNPVLSDVSLHVAEGSNLGLIGPGGAGKSLLVKIIAGLVKPDSGQVTIDGQELTKLSEIDMAQVRSKIGMLFQNYALFDFMNVGENIAFPLRQAGDANEEEIRSKVTKLLQQVSLPGIEKLQINELSGGMKKRVSFARAVVRNPPFLFYDDPTAGLDPVTSSKIFLLLEQIKQQHGTTSITISHDIVGMRHVCDRWAMLNKGELVFSGTVEEIEQCPNATVGEFWRAGLQVPQ
jgi:phospholipid/cholesterol/gamma-HCH transport system ATP-binding protein